MNVTSRSARAALLVLLLLPLLGACDLVNFLLNQQPNTTNVRLVNDGDFNVDVTLYIGDNQDVPKDVLTATGTKLEFTLLPGQTTPFSRDCDDLQAIVIDNAELRIIGDIGPDDDTDVLRDGTDFGCGDTIIFTFDHSDILTDFAITTSVQRRE